MSVPFPQKSHKRGMKGDTVNVRRSVRVKTKVPWIPPGKSSTRHVGCKWEVGSFLVGLPSWMGQVLWGLKLHTSQGWSPLMGSFNTTCPNEP